MIIGSYPFCQHPFYRDLQVIRGFDHGLQPSLVVAAALAQLLLDALEPLARLGRRIQGEIQRQETHTIGPAKGRELESLQAQACIVFINPSQEFNHFGARTVIGAVVKNQNLLALFIGQHIEETDNNQAQHELPPVILRVFEEIIGGILFEPQFRIFDDAPGKIDSTKRWDEDNGEQRKRVLLLATYGFHCR